MTEAMPERIERLESALRWIARRKPSDIKANGEIGADHVEHGRAAYDMWACAEATLRQTELIKAVADAAPGVDQVKREVG